MDFDENLYSFFPFLKKILFLHESLHNKGLFKTTLKLYIADSDDSTNDEDKQSPNKLPNKIPNKIFLSV